MKLNEWKRVKHHHYPGDVSKREKVALREKSKKKLSRSQSYKKGKFVVTPKMAKTYRKVINAKTRAVGKRRTKAAIKEEMGL